MSAATMKEQISQPRRIALYLHTDKGFGGTPWYLVGKVGYSSCGPNYEPLPEGQQRELPRQDFTRVSEVFEVTFTSLTNDEVVQNAVAALDEAERNAIDNLNKRLVEIRARKAQLLALTHQPEIVS